LSNPPPSSCLKTAKSNPKAKKTVKFSAKNEIKTFEKDPIEETNESGETAESLERKRQELLKEITILDDKDLLTKPILRSEDGTSLTIGDLSIQLVQSAFSPSSSSSDIFHDEVSPLFSPLFTHNLTDVVSQDFEGMEGAEEDAGEGDEYWEEDEEEEDLDDLDQDALDEWVFQPTLRRQEEEMWREGSRQEKEDDKEETAAADKSQADQPIFTGKIVFKDEEWSDEDDR